MHSVVTVNGIVTEDVWTALPTAFVGLTYGERIDSPTPNYTGKKMIEVWVAGTLRSRSRIYATCSDALTGTSGPYGAIYEATVF